ncbi:TetR/AcrR family transcriptional regulator [Marinomonas sp. 2405UD68-3]|uniref:TetR/AcrR family transcriptional regulator n=1 Tax=Marinomonas sp. 2405UD68-3 TaxID=3391835 RepID=UPI0039C9C1C9
MRKCAARAGVSHSAPAHHFDGLKGLTSAICQEGFQIFARSMQDQIDKAKDDPYERLVGMCEGYILFFNTTKHLQILVSTCKPFKSNKMGDENLEFAVWSMIQIYCNSGK